MDNEKEITALFFGELLLLVGSAIAKRVTPEQHSENINEFLKKYSKWECTRNIIRNMEKELVDRKKEATEKSPLKTD